MRTGKLFLILVLLLTITLITTSAVSADFWDWITGDNEGEGEVELPTGQGEGEDEPTESVPSGGGGSSEGSEAAHPPEDYPDTSDLEGPGVITNWILLKAPNGNYWMVTVDNNGSLITSPFEGEIEQPGQEALPEEENENEDEED